MLNIFRHCLLLIDVHTTCTYSDRVFHSVAYVRVSGVYKPKRVLKQPKKRAMVFLSRSVVFALCLTHCLGVVYVIFGVRLFAVYWIVLNGMKHRVDNVLMKQKCNAASYVCATFSFSTIICKCLNSLNVFVCVWVKPVWAQWEAQRCSLLTVCRTIEIEFSVGIVIVFMTIVFTWMPADFSITFAQNHCFGSQLFLAEFLLTHHNFGIWCAWVCFVRWMLTKRSFVAALINPFFANQLWFITNRRTLEKVIKSINKCAAQFPISLVRLNKIRCLECAVHLDQKTELINWGMAAGENKRWQKG